MGAALEKNINRSGRLIRLGGALLLALGLTILAASCKRAHSEDVPLPQEHQIYAGTSVRIDGIAEVGEWADAVKAEIAVPNRDNVEVWLKHDGNNLLLLFDLHNPGPANVLFPEILIDANGDRSSIWQADDRWFHVSATDCFSQGAPLNYSGCQREQPDWTAEANFAQGVPSDVDIIEVAIPFAKAGVTIGKAFGLALCATNTVDLSRFWPVTALLYNPSTWNAVRIVF